MTGLSQINREESFTPVSSYIQPKLVPQEGKAKLNSNNTKIAFSMSSKKKAQRAIISRHNKRNIACASLGALAYAQISLTP